jgi:hypothetical protein
VRGDVVGQEQEGERATDVLVVLDPKARTTLAGIGDLPWRWAYAVLSGTSEKSIQPLCSALDIGHDNQVALFSGSCCADL